MDNHIVNSIGEIVGCGNCPAESLQDQLLGYDETHTAHEGKADQVNEYYLNGVKTEKPELGFVDQVLLVDQEYTFSGLPGGGFAHIGDDFIELGISDNDFTFSSDQPDIVRITFNCFPCKKCEVTIEIQA